MYYLDYTVKITVEVALLFYIMFGFRLAYDG